MGKKWTYQAEDIFEEMPESPEEVLMKIPEEVCQEVGLVPGDNVKVSVGDQGTIIIEKIEDGKE